MHKLLFLNGDEYDINNKKTFNCSDILTNIWIMENLACILIKPSIAIRGIINIYIIINVIL